MGQLLLRAGVRVSTSAPCPRGTNSAFKTPEKLCTSLKFHRVLESVNQHNHVVPQMCMSRYFPDDAFHATCNLDSFVWGLGSQGSNANWPPLVTLLNLQSAGV